MATLDLIIIGVTLLSLIVGWMRGVIKELMSLVSWGAALFLAYVFYKQAGALIRQFLPLNETLSQIGGFIVIVVIALILASIITYLVSSLVETIGLKGADRGLGALFGVVRGVIILAVFVLFAINLKINSSEWYQKSQLIGYVEPVAQSIYNMLPSNISDHFKQNETPVAAGNSVDSVSNAGQVVGEAVQQLTNENFNSPATSSDNSQSQIDAVQLPEGGEEIIIEEGAGQTGEVSQ